MSPSQRDWLRIRIAGLAVDIQSGLAVSDARLLRRHVGPYEVADASPGDGNADVELVGPDDELVGPDDLDPGGKPDAPSVTFAVRVPNYRPGGPAHGSAAEQYVVRMGGGPVRVAGTYSDTAAVVGAIHAGLSLVLPSRGGFLAHAAVVGVDGRALVFPGPSGLGKTTAAAAVPGAVRLAEDRCALRRTGDGWVASAVPTWPGRYPPQPPMELPVGAVVLVRKGVPLRVARVERLVAVQAVASSMTVVRHPSGVQAEVLDLAADLVDRCPTLELSYKLGEEFWPSLREVLASWRAEDGPGGAGEGAAVASGAGGV